MIFIGTAVVFLSKPSSFGEFEDEGDVPTPIAPAFNFFCEKQKQENSCNLMKMVNELGN